MADTFFIGDTHFGHVNILKFEPRFRPFKDIQEHDEALIENWNQVVKAQDTVYHLGDFSFGSLESVHRIGSRLLGKKHLVMGNHDHRNAKEYAKVFEDLHGAVYFKDPSKKGDRYLLTHYPVRDTEHYVANIHGHLHSKVVEGDWPEKVRGYWNVSAERVGLTPINWEELKTW